MQRYLDIHRNVEGTAEDLAEAHRADLETQAKYDGTYDRYGADEEESTVFCLFEAPNKEAGEKVHREVHGLVADEIFEVTEGK
jgi:hypothetical protein